jgi:DNA invertase Pin-like site-specific DNA recombinase
MASYDLRLGRPPASNWAQQRNAYRQPPSHIFAALAEFERGVIRERTLAGLQAARARGRLGGRPPALVAKDLAAAKAMLQDPEITVAEVAKRLGVAASTLYRHLPRARTTALDA